MKLAKQMLGILLTKIATPSNSFPSTDFRMLLQPASEIPPQETLKQFEPEHNTFALSLAVKCLENPVQLAQQAQESVNLELSLRMINEELFALADTSQKQLV